MNIRLTKFAEGHKLLDKKQIGFVKKCRTTDHLLTLKVLSKKYVSNVTDGKLYTCFVDFKKAFDTVWHNGLFHKLEQMNINGNFLLTLENMYKNTKCAVKLNNKLTQFFPCMKGVRQGDPLSPMLFNLYINDIFKELNEGGCDPVYLTEGQPINGLAYADDLVLVSATKEGLQKAINILQKYCKNWKLTVNLDKTKCMTFTKGTQKEKTIFSLDNGPIENVSEIKYLGTLINKKNCSFLPTIKYLKTKATRALYSLNSKLNIYRTPIKTSLKIFDALIRPILLYASEIYEPYSKQDSSKWDNGDIERTHMQFLKRILGVNRSTTNILVRGELKRHSLQEEVLRRTIRHAKSIQEKDDSYLVKQAYNYELQCDLTSNSYFSKIQEYAHKLQEIHQCFHPYADPFLNIYEIPTDKLKTYMDQIFHSEWRIRLEDSTKGETYRSFKNNMAFEPYLFITNRKERVSLTKLRISDHKLGIEEGRRCRPITPREQRTCTMCTSEIDNECHFLLNCKLHSHKELIDKTVSLYPQFNALDNSQKFIYIMSQEDPNLITLLAKSVQTSFKFRALMDEYFYK